MKKRIFISLCASILLFACASDDLTVEEMTLPKAEQKVIVSLISKNLSIEKSVPVSIDSVRLKKIGDSFYLASYHNDEITTTLLKVTENNTLRYAGISCTSKHCSTDEGCIPHKDGKKCTKCEWSSDCTKTVTSGDIVE